MKKMQIALVALDMDGTLLGEDHIGVSVRNRRALEALAERGTEIVLATGRSPSFVRELAQQLPMVRYGLLSNGACVYDFSKGRQTSGRPLDLETSRFVMNLLLPYPSCMVVYSGGLSYARVGAPMEQLAFPERFIHKLRQWCLPLEDPARQLQDKLIDKVDVMLLPESVQPEIEQKLREHGGVAITSSLPGNIEFNSDRVSKGAALCDLCAQLHIPQEQVVAFGDSTNDVEMLEWAGLSYAMQNGCDTAKRAAAAVAPPNTQDGVARVLERLMKPAACPL